jgi:signal transduction histidine kinase
MYAARVKRNCCSDGSNGKDLSYWRNNLFAGTIIYLLPFCLIALAPGIYLSLITGLYILAAINIFAATGMAVIAFMPAISLAVRKAIFLGCLYILSFGLLHYLGLYGPGLLYLLTASIFSILIFPAVYAFWPAWLNTCICIFFACYLLLGFIPPWPPQAHYSAAEWAGVSSNLVFLSFLCAALIPHLFNGLQETINTEKKLKEALDMKQQSLQQALHLLEQKNNELEQFAYVASHDLKEPLRMVTTFMGSLQNKYSSQLDERARTYIGFAIDGGKRMQKMIDDLLELSRTARLDKVKEAADLAEILEEVQQNIAQLIEDTGARVIVKARLPVLAVYRAGISRLWQNLLINAIKFRKKEVPPVVKISAAEREGDWLFSIEDNGIGIEPEYFEKVFDIFTRLHAQQTYEGTGIGLAICKKVVEQHGGSIWVTSEEGKGSIFYFTIKKQQA